VILLSGVALSGILTSVEGSTPQENPADAPWSVNIKISDDPGTQGQNEVSIVSDINGNIVAGWNDNRKSTGGPAYNCAWTYSSDGGKTWSPNELYQGPEPECGDPVVAQDWKGGIYRLGMSFDRNGNTAHLMVSHTTDGGKTWGPWHTAIDSQSSGGFNDKPWMAAYGDNVYVTWTLFGGGEIMFIKSTDGGATWSTPKQLGTGQGSCILTDNSGNIYVGWGTSTIRFTKSTDGGATFAQTKTIGNGGGGGSNPRSAPLPGCAVDPAGTHIYFTWAGDTGGGSEDVWVVASHDGGNTWGTQTKVNDDTNNARQIMPWIALDKNNVPHVAWNDWRNGKVDAYYSNSTDGGQTWAPNQRVTDDAGSSISFQGDYNGITVTPSGRVVFAWCDTRNGNGDIYIAYADLGAGGGGGGQVLTRIEVTPQNPTITADQTQQFTAIGYDQNNKQMTINPVWSATGGSIDATGLYTPNKAGVYMVTASQGNVSGSTNITVTPGAPARLEVTPKSATITADETQQFNASATDAKGNPVQVTPVWSTTGGKINSTGLYTPDKAGTYTVTARSGSLSDSASITVNPGKAAKIRVDPAKVTITADDTVRFNATVTDAKDNPVSAGVTWSVTGGSIDSNGVYTPGKVGVYTITATSGTLSANAEVTVTHGKIANIMIDPPEATIEEGEKVKFSVKNATDAKGNEIPMSEVTVTWSTGNASIGKITQTGEFTGVSPGETSVIASVSDGKGHVNVTASVTVRAKPKGPDLSGNMLWLLLIIVIVVVAIIVALVVLKRRKKPQPAYPGYEFYPQYAPQQFYPQPYPDQAPQPGYPPQGGYP